MRKTVFKAICINEYVKNIRLHSFDPTLRYPSLFWGSLGLLSRNSSIISTLFCSNGNQDAELTVTWWIFQLPLGLLQFSLRFHNLPKPRRPIRKKHRDVDQGAKKRYHGGKFTAWSSYKKIYQTCLWSSARRKKTAKIKKKKKKTRTPLASSVHVMVVVQ